ncbi:heat shock protein 23 [Drosophila grimshawi]|uniref:GH14700 n=1 Tax=Drosophila grimshawi TaxID=7222 RepID=B4IX99_DROGR|nr:heat shock protein 23 [Drosophila grimshawi]EDV97431.1 GH14700 [Drosophila grimshawi]
MALSNLLSMAEALQPTRSHLDYDFGLGMHPRQLQAWCTTPSQPLLAPWQCQAWPSPAHRRCKRATAENGEGWPVCQVGKDGFQVCMDVTQFTPSELCVKVVENCIVVEGKHEERADDHGYISRHFVRRYSIPKGYEADKVISSLSSDGVLTINMPKPQAIQDKSKERVVQIQQVGPAHLNVKQNDVDHKQQNDPKSKSGTGNTK